MKIAIIGAGIGGLTTAIALRKIGIDAHVYEQTASFQPIGAGIGIGSNAMLILQKLNVATDVLAAGMPLHEQRFYNANMQLMNTIDFTLLKDRFGEETIAIQRADLHTALFEAFDPNDIYLNHRVTHLSQQASKVIVTFNDTIHKTFDYVIAADGIHSIFRQTMIPTSKPRYANYTCWRGITKNIKHVQPHISSEAWAPFGRFGWAPLKNDAVYWFVCVNASENDEHFQRFDKLDVAKHFAKYSKQVEQLILQTENEYFLHHDLYDIRPIKKYAYGNILLLGDAAHATTPNMGQGAGQAIEDAYVLMESLQKTCSIEKAFKRYEQKRWKKARKVITLSRQIGWAAQWSHPILVKARDMIFPLIPKQLLFWRLTFLFKDK